MVASLVSVLLSFSVLSEDLVCHEDDQPTVVSRDDDLCDDGRRPYVSSGRPYWECERNGCTFDSPSCWYEENMCFDENGTYLLEDESCPLLTTECESALSCFDLFFGCEGNYYCLEWSYGVCKHGTCVENMEGVVIDI